MSNYTNYKLILCNCYILHQGLKPLYEKLHAYVRNKLAAQYPGKVASSWPIRMLLQISPQKLWLIGCFRFNLAVPCLHICSEICGSS